MNQCGKASNNFNFLQKFNEFEGKTIWKGKVSNNQIIPLAHHVGKGSPMRGFQSSGDMSLLQPPPYQEETGNPRVFAEEQGTKVVSPSCGFTVTIWVPFSWKHLDPVLLHPQNTNIKTLRIHGFLMIFRNFQSQICLWLKFKVLESLSRASLCPHPLGGTETNKKTSMFDVSDETNFVRNLWSFLKQLHIIRVFLDQPDSWTNQNPLTFIQFGCGQCTKLLYKSFCRPGKNVKLWRAHIYIKRWEA